VIGFSQKIEIWLKPSLLRVFTESPGMLIFKLKKFPSTNLYFKRNQYIRTDFDQKQESKKNNFNEKG